MLTCSNCDFLFVRRRDIPVKARNYCGLKCREESRLLRVLTKSREKILKAIAALEGTPYGVTDIARKAGLDRNTVTRHYKMMREERKKT